MDGRARGHAGSLASIQALRGLAAVSVVVFHAFQWLDDQDWIGAAGVDVFFVISGFIIWTVTAERETKPASFLWRRITRVAPAYWLVTVAVALAALVDPAFLPQVSVSPRHLILSLAFISHTDPNGLVFPVLPPGWSLNYEAMFYLLFAGTLFAPARWRLPAATAALAAVCALGLLDPPLYGLGANLMLLQFAAGLWLGRRHALGRDPEPEAGLIFVLLGLALFVAMGVLGIRQAFWRPFLWGLPAVMIVGGAVAVESGWRLRWPAPLVKLGDASYAIYLCHMPAVALVAHTLGVHPAALFVSLAVAASIAAGTLFHLAVEVPLIAACRRLPGRLRRHRTRAEAPGRTP